ncbi:hypothetical protein HHI36_020225 [Cryptolaemus montrouzieri]|uniref:Uncharacterized protein n=1 Tax=Cryptolaemus montrouzieri TaxID=559131 RepID=A0ABD2NAN6_9CUCU
MSYVDASYYSNYEDRFPFKILRTTLEYVGVIKNSPDGSSCLDVDNPSLLKLKEFFKDSDYCTDDDTQETTSDSNEETHTEPSTSTSRYIAKHKLPYFRRNRKDVRHCSNDIAQSTTSSSSNNEDCNIDLTHCSTGLVQSITSTTVAVSSNNDDQNIDVGHCSTDIEQSNETLSTSISLSNKEDRETGVAHSNTGFEKDKSPLNSSISSLSNEDLNIAHCNAHFEQNDVPSSTNTSSSNAEDHSSTVPCETKLEMPNQLYSNDGYQENKDTCSSKKENIRAPLSDLGTFNIKPNLTVDSSLSNTVTNTSLADAPHEIFRNVSITESQTIIDIEDDDVSFMYWRSKDSRFPKPRSEERPVLKSSVTRRNSSQRKNNASRTNKRKVEYRIYETITIASSDEEDDFEVIPTDFAAHAKRLEVQRKKFDFFSNLNGGIYGNMWTRLPSLPTQGSNIFSNSKSLINANEVCSIEVPRNQMTSDSSAVSSNTKTLNESSKGDTVDVKKEALSTRTPRNKNVINVKEDSVNIDRRISNQETHDNIDPIFKSSNVADKQPSLDITSESIVIDDDEDVEECILKASNSSQIEKPIVNQNEDSIEKMNEKQPSQKLMNNLVGTIKIRQNLIATKISSDTQGLNEIHQNCDEQYSELNTEIHSHGLKDLTPIVQEKPVLCSSLDSDGIVIIDEDEEQNSGTKNIETLCVNVNTNQSCDGKRVEKISTNEWNKSNEKLGDTKIHLGKQCNSKIEESSYRDKVEECDVKIKEQSVPRMSEDSNCIILIDDDVNSEQRNQENGKTKLNEEVSEKQSNEMIPHTFLEESDLFDNEKSDEIEEKHKNNRNYSVPKSVTSFLKKELKLPLHAECDDKIIMIDDDVGKIIQINEKGYASVTSEILKNETIGAISKSNSLKVSAEKVSDFESESQKEDSSSVPCMTHSESTVVIDDEEKSGKGTHEPSRRFIEPINKDDNFAKESVEQIELSEKEKVEVEKDNENLINAIGNSEEKHPNKTVDINASEEHSTILPGTSTDSNVTSVAISRPEPDSENSEKNKECDSLNHTVIIKEERPVALPILDLDSIILIDDEEDEVVKQLLTETSAEKAVDEKIHVENEILDIEINNQNQMERQKTETLVEEINSSENLINSENDARKQNMQKRNEIESTRKSSNCSPQISAEDVMGDQNENPDGTAVKEPSPLGDLESTSIVSIEDEAENQISSNIPQKISEVVTVEKNELFDNGIASQIKENTNLNETNMSSRENGREEMLSLKNSVESQVKQEKQTCGIERGDVIVIDKDNKEVEHAVEKQDLLCVIQDDNKCSEEENNTEKHNNLSDVHCEKHTSCENISEENTTVQSTPDEISSLVINKSIETINSPTDSLLASESIEAEFPPKIAKGEDESITVVSDISSYENNCLEEENTMEKHNNLSDVQCEKHTYCENISEENTTLQSTPDETSSLVINKSIETINSSTDSLLVSENIEAEFPPKIDKGKDESITVVSDISSNEKSTIGLPEISKVNLVQDDKESEISMNEKFPTIDSSEISKVNFDEESKQLEISENENEKFATVGLSDIKKGNLDEENEELEINSNQKLSIVGLTEMSKVKLDKENKESEISSNEKAPTVSLSEMNNVNFDEEKKDPDSSSNEKFPTSDLSEISEVGLDELNKEPEMNANEKFPKSKPEIIKVNLQQENKKSETIEEHKEEQFSEDKEIQEDIKHKTLLTKKSLETDLDSNGLLNVHPYDATQTLLPESVETIADDSDSRSEESINEKTESSKTSKNHVISTCTDSSVEKDYNELKKTLDLSLKPMETERFSVLDVSSDSQQFYSNVSCSEEQESSEFETSTQKQEIGQALQNATIYNLDYETTVVDFVDMKDKNTESNEQEIYDDAKNQELSVVGTKSSDIVEKPEKQNPISQENVAIVNTTPSVTPLQLEDNKSTLQHESMEIMNSASITESFNFKESLDHDVQGSSKELETSQQQEKSEIDSTASLSSPPQKVLNQLDEVLEKKPIPVKSTKKNKLKSMLVDILPKKTLFVKIDLLTKRIVDERLKKKEIESTEDKATLVEDAEKIVNPEIGNTNKDLDNNKTIYAVDNSGTQSPPVNEIDQVITDENSKVESNNSTVQEDSKEISKDVAMPIIKETECSTHEIYTSNSKNTFTETISESNILEENVLSTQETIKDFTELSSKTDIDASPTVENLQSTSSCGSNSVSNDVVIIPENSDHYTSERSPGLQICDETETIDNLNNDSSNSGVNKVGKIEELVSLSPRKKDNGPIDDISMQKVKAAHESSSEQIGFKNFNRPEKLNLPTRSFANKLSSDSHNVIGDLNKARMLVEMPKRSFFNRSLSSPIKTKASVKDLSFPLNCNSELDVSRMYNEKPFHQTYISPDTKEFCYNCNSECICRKEALEIFANVAANQERLKVEDDKKESKKSHRKERQKVRVDLCDVSESYVFKSKKSLFTENTQEEKLKHNKGFPPSDSSFLPELHPLPNSSNQFRKKDVKSTRSNPSTRKKRTKSEPVPAPLAKRRKVLKENKQEKITDESAIQKKRSLRNTTPGNTLSNIETSNILGDTFDSDDSLPLEERLRKNEVVADETSAKSIKQNKKEKLSKSKKIKVKESKRKSQRGKTKQEKEPPIQQSEISLVEVASTSNITQNIKNDDLKHNVIVQKVKPEKFVHFKKAIILADQQFSQVFNNTSPTTIKSPINGITNLKSDLQNENGNIDRKLHVSSNETFESNLPLINEQLINTSSAVEKGKTGEVLGKSTELQKCESILEHVDVKINEDDMRNNWLTSLTKNRRTNVRHSTIEEKQFGGVSVGNLHEKSSTDDSPPNMSQHDKSFKIEDEPTVKDSTHVLNMESSNICASKDSLNTIKIQIQRDDQKEKN